MTECLFHFPPLSVHVPALPLGFTVTSNIIWNIATEKGTNSCIHHSHRSNMGTVTWAWTVMAVIWRCQP